MQLDPEACYRAVMARDPRFDGRFFTAVRTTGIYCRPICPARIPHRKNCTFVISAAAAQELGYRPCLRCRPEASPGSPSWCGTSALVSRALRLIGAGALDCGSVDDLAAKVGVGARHLRRLFIEHLGASPLAVAQTRRVFFAKKLIDETAWPMTRIALAAGFGSLRRFNDALDKTFHCSPRELRRGRAGTRDSEIELKLTYRPPLAWPAMVAYLEARATPGVEALIDGRYRRTIRTAEGRGWVEVRDAASAHHLVARVVLDQPAGLIGVVGRLRSMFDLDADPTGIATCLAADAQLASRIRSAPGLRVPGAWDGFELAVRAILGQQVTVKGATTLAGRLAAAFGSPVDVATAWPPGLRGFFPEPKDLEQADLERIGLTAARATAIRALASGVLAGHVRLDGSVGPDEVARSLTALPGVGDWTASYVAMRALREPDAFPSGDLGLRRATARDGNLPSPRTLEQRAEAWRPWRSYAAMYLWHGESEPEARRVVEEAKA